MYAQSIILHMIPLDHLISIIIIFVKYFVYIIIIFVKYFLFTSRSLYIMENAEKD